MHGSTPRPTTLGPPPDGTTHWSVRRLAAATGISPTTVHRIWTQHKLKPHQVRSFKFSKDPRLAEKVIDVVGLYLDPPAGALVLCVDEKTQIQALDRTQPSLPIKPGKAARMTHDYKPNGTTSLYAALEIATGEVTGACYPRHRHQEFLAFVNQLVRAYPRATVLGLDASAGRKSSAKFPSPIRSTASRSISSAPRASPNRTRCPKSNAGWLATSACTSTSPRPAHPG